MTVISPGEKSTRSHLQPSSRSPWRETGSGGAFVRGIFLAASMLVIFAADTVTHYEIAIPVLYTIVVLGAAFSSRPATIVVLTLACLALTGLSFVFTLHGNPAAGLVNLAISSAAIIVTAFLAVRMQHAKDLALLGQARLTRLAHIRTVSGLASSLVHELNQPLAAVTMSGQACQRWLAAVPPNLARADAALDRIVRDATRAADILSRMSDLTRPRETERKVFSLAEAVRDVLSMSRHSLDRHAIRARLHDQSGQGLAFADPVQIQQVIGNLLLNALESLASSREGDRHIDILIGYEEGLLLCRVSDDGAGVARHLADHLFEPFWSTKPEGTGIGLAISRTLIEANGGRIWLCHDRGAGASFCFTVPVHGEGEQS